MATNIVENIFSDNLNAQVLTYATNRYKAGILEFDCFLPMVRLMISKNTISRTQFVGRHSTFFYINSGIAKIHDNSMSYSGLLTSVVHENDSATYLR